MTASSVDSLVIVDKAKTASFISAATKISEGLSFNKKIFRSLNVKDTLMQRVADILGKEQLYLEDEAGLRLYIKDTFGSQGLALFRSDATNSLHLDTIHALLFYQYIAKALPEKTEQAKAVFYRILSQSLPASLEAMARLSVRGRIEPIFELSSKFFRWKRCPEFLYAYMMDITASQGYKAYYLEKPNLAQIVYLVFKGHTFQEAEELVRKKTDGLVIRNLPTELESNLFLNIFGGEFTNDLFDGFYAQQVMDDMNRVAQVYPLTEGTMYTGFSLFIRPQMIEVMGAILTGVQDELRSNPIVGTDDVNIYHLSPSRIGVLVKDTVNLEDAFPTMHEFFKLVKPFTLDEDYLLSGGWL